jgi:hypothetical protein
MAPTQTTGTGALGSALTHTLTHTRTHSLTHTHTHKLSLCQAVVTRVCVRDTGSSCHHTCFGASRGQCLETYSAAVRECTDELACVWLCSCCAAACVCLARGCVRENSCEASVVLNSMRLPRQPRRISSHGAPAAVALHTSVLLLIFARTHSPNSARTRARAYTHTHTHTPHFEQD